MSGVSMVPSKFSLLARVTSPAQPFLFALGYVALAAMIYGVYRLARRSLASFRSQNRGRGTLFAVLAFAQALFVLVAGFFLVEMTAFLLFWES